MRHKALIVGLGSIGMLYDLESSDQAHVLSHAKAFSQHENFVLAAGVDPDPIARKKFSDKYGAWSGHDLAEALRISCPDVVVLASPTNTHAEILKSILAHAKPKVVLCEKPISYSLQEAQYMVSACRDANCLFFVNYLRRVEPGVVEIKRRLVAGEIQAPAKGVVWYTKGLIHNGSHFVNLLEFWLGAIQEAVLIDAARISNNLDFQANVRVSFKRGEALFIAVPDHYFTHHEIHLVCPNGCLRYENGGAKMSWQPVDASTAGSQYSLLTETTEVIPTEAKKLQAVVTHELSKALNGFPTSLCTGEDALATLNALANIRDLSI